MHEFIIFDREPGSQKCLKVSNQVRRLMRRREMRVGMTQSAMTTQTGSPSILPYAERPRKPKHRGTKRNARRCRLVEFAVFENLLKSHWSGSNQTWDKVFSREEDEIFQEWLFLWQWFFLILMANVARMGCTAQVSNYAYSFLVDMNFKTPTFCFRRNWKLRKRQKKQRQMKSSGIYIYT